jgi:hypothetical protein
VGYEAKGEFVPQTRTPVRRKNSQGAYWGTIEVDNRHASVHQVVRGGLEFENGRASHAACALEGRRRFLQSPQNDRGFMRLGHDVVPEPAGRVPPVNVDIRVAHGNGTSVQFTHRLVREQRNSQRGRKDILTVKDP